VVGKRLEGRGLLLINQKMGKRMVSGSRKYEGHHIFSNGIKGKSGEKCFVQRAQKNVRRRGTLCCAFRGSSGGRDHKLPRHRGGEKNGGNFIDS